MGPKLNSNSDGGIGRWREKKGEKKKSQEGKTAAARAGDRPGTCGGVQ